MTDPIDRLERTIQWSLYELQPTQPGKPRPLAAFVQTLRSLSADLLAQSADVAATRSEYGLRLTRQARDMRTTIALVQLDIGAALRPELREQIARMRQEMRAQLKVAA